MLIHSLKSVIEKQNFVKNTLNMRTVFPFRIRILSVTPYTTNFRVRITTIIFNRRWGVRLMWMLMWSLFVPSLTSFARYCSCHFALIIRSRSVETSFLTSTVFNQVLYWEYEQTKYLEFECSFPLYMVPMGTLPMAFLQSKKLRQALCTRFHLHALNFGIYCESVFAMTGGTSSMVFHLEANPIVRKVFQYHYDQHLQHSLIPESSILMSDISHPEPLNFC